MTRGDEENSDPGRAARIALLREEEKRLREQGLLSHHIICHAYLDINPLFFQLPGNVPSFSK